ncbi:GDP-mannose 4,6-dehydratase [Peribacillus sp. NPDC097206]|uniref:GDP-mannose 4,6-dehydratase n=1 Tax=unclassified Peribacillus TaxID=2675266 RepID=UPI0038193D76
MKSAIITGQDGAYLARFLLNKVYGLMARRSTSTIWRLAFLEIQDEVELIEGDMTDLAYLIKAMEISKTDELYNLAA